MGIEYAGYFLIAAAALFLVVKIFAWPIRMLGKLIINGVLGVILLLIFNFAGQYFGLYIQVTWITALIAGFFGIPGIIFLIIYELFL